MFEYIIITALVYIGSAAVLLLLDYTVKKAITVQDILVAVTPLISTIALVMGIITLVLNWYKNNKNKVIINNKKKPNQKKKVTPVIPKPSK